MKKLIVRLNEEKKVSLLMENITKLNLKVNT